MRGAAVRIDAGGLSGYVPTTDFPQDPADRTATFDIGEDELRGRLPVCPPAA